MSGLQNKMNEHWLSRDFKTSARLYLQHWLFQSTIGYILDPAIVAALGEDGRGQAGKPLRVADLACGNGAWLLDLAENPPAGLSTDNLELYGFDILPSHFPSTSHIPSNVRLSKRDILDAQIPEDLAESFDIVHIRAFGSTIRNDDISPVCQAAKRLLKPGGFLQWDEADSSNMAALLDGKLAPRGTGLLKMLEAGGKATGTTFGWHGTIKQQFEQNGLVDVKHQKHELKPYQYKAWTEDYLLAYEDVGQMLPSAKDVPEAPLSREGYEALFASVVQEAGQGMVMHSGHVWTATARKGSRSAGG